MTEKKLKKYNKVWAKIKEKINCKVKKPEIWPWPMFYPDFIHLKKFSKPRKGEKNRKTEKKLKQYNETWVKIKEKIKCKVEKPEIWPWPMFYPDFIHLKKFPKQRKGEKNRKTEKKLKQYKILQFLLYFIVT